MSGTYSDHCAVKEEPKYLLSNIHVRWHAVCWFTAAFVTVFNLASFKFVNRPVHVTKWQRGKPNVIPGVCGSALCLVFGWFPVPVCVWISAPLELNLSICIPIVS